MNRRHRQLRTGWSGVTLPTGMKWIGRRYFINLLPLVTISYSGSSDVNLDQGRRDQWH